jgi:hypothetical protein
MKKYFDLLEDEEELAKQVVGRCRGMDHLEELLAEENGLQH